MPVSAVTETTIARWVKQLGGSGKTISNKHGFLSGAFNAAVRAGVMTSNPCQGRRLSHTRVEETVFLSPPEFVLLRDHIEKSGGSAWPLGWSPPACASRKPQHSPQLISTPTPRPAELTRPGSTPVTTARDRASEDEEIDPNHQLAARSAGGHRPDGAGLPVHQRCRQPRSRTRVLQRGLEARPRQRHEGGADEVAARARPATHLRLLDESAPPGPGKVRTPPRWALLQQMCTPGQKKAYSTNRVCFAR